MLELHVPKQEWYDPKTSQFVTFLGQTLQLEHSLLSVSKWESITHKPFLSKEGMTQDEFLLYVRCMTINRNQDDMVYKVLSNQHKKTISEYIENPMTATWFGKEEGKGRAGRKIITSELIYYWMIAAQVPMSCEKWHLNRLMTLLHICEIKNRPQKKGKRRSTAQDASLNAARRASMGTRG